MSSEYVSQKWVGAFECAGDQLCEWRGTIYHSGLCLPQGGAQTAAFPPREQGRSTSASSAPWGSACGVLEGNNDSEPYRGPPKRGQDTVCR